MGPFSFIQLFTFTFFLIFSTIQSTGQAQEATIQEVAIKPSEEKILASQKIPSKSIGFILLNPETGEVIAKHNHDKTFIPASTTKILSSLYALEILGGDFQFETKLSYNGRIQDGILKGDLVLKGSGDPFLTGSQLFDFALELKKLGVTQLKGRLLFDDSFLTKEKIIDPLGLKDQTYNPGFSALNLDFNRITLWREGPFKSTKKSQIFPIPAIETFFVEKSASRFLAGEKFNNKTNTENEIWEVHDSLRYSQREFIPVRNSSLYTAETFRLMCRNLGIEIPKAEAGKHDGPLKPIHIHKSKPLVQIAEDSLEYSNNLFAEMMMIRAANEGEEKPLTIGESARKMIQWFSKEIPSPGWKNLHFVNGSGLSPENMISPWLMSQILKFANEKKYNERNFTTLLSVSGMKGWIENRLHDPKHSLRVWAKTGTLDFVITLAGYLLTEQKKKLAFVLFINDFEKRTLLNNAKGKTSLALQAEAKKWKGNAQKTQDDLLRLWMSQN